jgi:hypothetical protein
MCERKNSIEHFAVPKPVTGAKGTCSCAVARKRGATHDRKLGVLLYILILLQCCNFSGSLNLTNCNGLIHSKEAYTGVLKFPYNGILNSLFYKSATLTILQYKNQDPCS